MNIGKAEEDKATPARAEPPVMEQPQPITELVPVPAVPPSSKPVVRSPVLNVCCLPTSCVSFSVLLAANRLLTASFPVIR